MAEDLWDSHVPLSNDQFRQLLETPLHKRKAALSERRHSKPREASKKAKATPIKEEPLKEESPELPNVAPLPHPGGTEPSDKPLYRRAAAAPTPPALLREGAPLGIVHRKGGNVRMWTMAAQKSKFLGGDLEHTHLVKGLDYALLNKERARLQKSESEKAKKEQQEREKEKKAKVQLSCLSNLKDRFLQKGVSFASPMGRAVYSAMFRPTKVEAQEFFRPGRMAFLYSLESADRTDYVPTVVRRPKAECEKSKGVRPGSDSRTVDTIAKIISCIRLAATDAEEKLRKREMLETLLGPQHFAKKEEEPQLIASSEAKAEPSEPQPEDDIFEDAGTDYKCDLTRRKKKRRPEATKPLPAAPSEKGQKTEVEDHEMLKMDKKTGRHIDPTSLPDHYAECYPGFHQSYSTAIADSDDEDFTQMDSRNKGISRYSFGTDEEWSKYKQNMEQLPKAAFQYGVKMTDGRKTQSKLVEKRRREQKLDSQLNKIEKLLKEEGKPHEAAFRSDKKGGSKPREDPTPAAIPTPKNRKRIQLP